MNQKSPRKQESNLAERIDKLEEKRVEIKREIEQLKNQGELAPPVPLAR